MVSIHEIIFQDEQRLIKITKPLIDLIRRNCQITPDYPESGGILIGRENISDNNIIIEFATAPMSKDIQKRTSFIRKDIGHILFYKRLYEKNNGIYRYIGEWHTHPENVPQYSFKDKNNWKKILKKDKYAEMQYHLIAGVKAIRVWKMSKGESNFPHLVYTQYWENIIN